MSYPSIDDIKKLLEQHICKAPGDYFQIDVEALAGELDDLLCDAFFAGQRDCCDNCPPGRGRSRE